jgi:UDP-glucose 4-epimerase
MIEEGCKITYKVAIIGGAGYVGSSLARFLADEFKVKVLDITSLPGDLKGRVDYARCDIRDFKEVVLGIEDADVVVNTAIIEIPLINEQKNLSYEVNVLGTQNLCRAVLENSRVKGLLVAGTWHVIGERGLKGLIDEEFGFRPDKVERRARLYALSKIMQETTVRFYDEMSSKVFGVLRMGTVLGVGMPEKTAANIFIERGLKGESITPFSHSMYRPMLYVDISDVCRGFKNFIIKILKGNFERNDDSLLHIFNVYNPNPITILELANMIQKTIIEETRGKINPKIEIVDSHLPTLFTIEGNKQIKIDVSKAITFLNLGRLKSTHESIKEIIKTKISIF